ncbi:Type IV pilus biogenesis and competence protein PilQ [invertebrate metagenome]|uniref:Type IV pilus biogenesis and competence protein PilQ n=1 Tax=invertebrate metagenome TaxID=1711999 RepID=A0A2H9T6R0_9ZZZZ
MDNKQDLKDELGRVALVLLLTACSASVPAKILEKIEAALLPGDVVELRLAFDGVPPKAQGYSIDQPPRLSIDLPYTRSKLPKYNEIGFKNAQNVTVLETNNRTRLVVSQADATSFSSKQDGNTLFVYLGSSQDKLVTGDVSNHVNPSSLIQENSSEIRNIDFQRGENGEGNIVITLGSSDIPMDVDELSGKIRLQFQGEILPEHLRNKLEVIDFGTPVKYIDAFIESGNTIVLIETSGKYEHLAYQADHVLTVSVKPLNDGYLSGRAQGITYKGDKLSLNFQDIDVRSVLQLIADFTQMNLVASDTVKGNVTLRLKNVPWDQVLDIILKAKGLDKRLSGNVLTVAPAEEMAAREKLQMENEKQLRELAPVYTDLIAVSYANAENIAAVLAGGEEEGGSLLTEQGSVQVVKRTNSLLIKDTQKKLDEIRALVKMLDIPVKQVMIEARIVTLNSNYKKELGVKWSGSKKIAKDSDNKGFGLGGTGSTASIKDGKPLFNLGDNVFTDLGATGAAANLAVGFATNSTILNLELSALLTDGGGEVVSQPKVITADKQEAIIKSGKEIPYATQAEGGGTTIEFKEATLSLKVTPQITPEGSIVMDIEVNNDDTTADAVDGTPILSKNEIKTQVLVKDGETVVLGGVFKQTQKKSVSKVPLLGDIPIVGNLFKQRTNSDDKEELMVFITPRILDQRTVMR